MNFIKQFLACIVLLVFSFFAVSQEVTIMSFNVQGHGNSEHNFGNSTWKNQIASVVKQSGASIVLLQEIRLRSEFDIDLLCETMTRKGGKWKAKTSFKYATCSYDLHNAVLFDESVVSFITDLAQELNLQKYHDSGVECRKYKFDQNNEQILEFSFPRNSKKTFYVVNVHAPGPGNIKLQEEKRQLEQFYSQHKRKVPLIIGGDFNLARKDFVPSSAFSDAIIDGDSGIFSDFNSVLTTVSTSDNGIRLAHGYDHFIIRGNYLFSLSEQMHHVFSKKGNIQFYDSIKIGNTTYKSASEYRQEVSDHLPIMVKLQF